MSYFFCFKYIDKCFAIITVFVFLFPSEPPTLTKRGVGGVEGNKKTFLLVSPSQKHTAFNFPDNLNRTWHCSTDGHLAEHTFDFS